MEVALLRWRELEAQQVAVKMALMMVRGVPASEVSQAEIQAACANEQPCGFLLSKSVRAPQARRLEPAPQAHLESQGTPDHSTRTRFSRRASRTGTRFNRSISIL